MDVRTFKIKLSPITHLFLKPTFTCSASFLSLTFKVLRGKGYKGIVSTALGFPGGRVIAPSWHQTPQVFLQGLYPSWTSSHFDVIFDSKLCIIRSHVFVLLFCLVVWCRTKMTRLILKVVVYLSIFEKKRTSNWSKPL